MLDFKQLTLYKKQENMNEMEVIETQCSINMRIHCFVKSKYLHNWVPRELQINPQYKTLEISSSQSEKKKSYPLQQIHYTRDAKTNCVVLTVSHDRSYEIKINKDLQFLLSEIDYYREVKNFSANLHEKCTPIPQKINYTDSNINKLGTPQKFATEIKGYSFPLHVLNKQNKNSLLQIKVFHQQHTPAPQKINYFKLEKQHKNSDVLPQKKRIFNQKKVEKKVQQKKEIQKFQRVSEYIKSSDWRRDPKNGCLLLINQEKKKLIPQMISYTAKRAITSGQFSNINFPTFAMKPQSVLQTYCKCLGAAPLILNTLVTNPIDRIKAFNAIVLSFSIQLNDIEKSFNPFLGQTFQGQIAGSPVYAEQISTNPHISYFMLQGESYKFYGNLELKANVGLNQAIGVFHGQLTLHFNDGGIIKGIMPKGVMSGVLIGQTKFGPIGSVYSYDPINEYVCSYETKKGDVMTGQIGKLKQSSFKRFQEFLKIKKYQNFKHIPQKQYERVLETIQVEWSDNISYGKKQYLSYRDKKILPIKMTQNLQSIGQKLLQSDSSFRKDIKLRQKNNIQQSQKQNDRLENEQLATQRKKKQYIRQ